MKYEDFIHFAESLIAILSLIMGFFDLQEPHGWFLSLSFSNSTFKLINSFVDSEISIDKQTN